MKTTAALLVLLGVASARPEAVKLGRSAPARLPPRAGRVVKFRREVPQEHSHEKILQDVNTQLQLNNPEQIQDAVFSLLGNAAAAAGAGTVTDLDCLQQHVADQAFTNALAANDVDGQVTALLFRALERNTGKVGLASVLCTETATNAPIAAITQHQDPASSGAAATNKQIVLDLAAQISAVGGDPQLALSTGTFAPGDVTDTTGAGNTCDDITDAGCIVDQNLLVDDATAAEIDAAVAAGGGASAGANASASNATAAATGAAKAARSPAPAAATGSATATAAGVDINAFTGSTGSAPVPVISSNAARPFDVNGSTFLNAGAAIQRACDVQKNACATAANSGGSGSVADCDTQQQACVAANATKKRRSLRV
ncbi:hypothetical protein BJ170DRAFT_255902 [Xylariales sp. AK1849]|nr:hypothetical protein BJ170DRAFT_255902 [Xylariales sp. AK1849]